MTEPTSPKRIHKRVAGKAKTKTREEFSGFIEFIRSQGVIGLAVGLVIGTQVKLLVDTLIGSFVNPIVGLFLPGEGDLVARTFVLSAGSKQAIFGWGRFFYALMNFVIVAAVIYVIYKWLRLDKLDKKK